MLIYEHLEHLVAYEYLDKNSDSIGVVLLAGKYLSSCHHILNALGGEL
jgi:hypothetical protein